MQLTHLSLTNLRNFTRLDVDVPSGVVILLGSNAQGKTSLLEAVYYLATLTSFHAENDRTRFTSQRCHQTSPDAGLYVELHALRIQR